MMDSQFSSLVMGIVVLEGLGRQLDPNIDIFAISKPMLQIVRQTDVKLPIGMVAKIAMANVLRIIGFEKTAPEAVTNISTSSSI